MSDAPKFLKEEMSMLKSPKTKEKEKFFKEWTAENWIKGVMGLMACAKIMFLMGYMPLFCLAGLYCLVDWWFSKSVLTPFFHFLIPGFCILGAILVVNVIGLVYRYKKWRKFRSGLPLSEEELPELHVYAKEDLVLYMQAYEYVEGFLHLPSRFCWEGMVDLFGPQHFEYDYGNAYWEAMEELYRKLPGYTVPEDDGLETDTLEEVEPTCANAILLQDVKEYFEKIVVDRCELKELENIKPVPVPVGQSCE